MYVSPFAIAGLWLIAAGAAQAAPSVDVEIATDRGVQITAPQEWLQLLAGIGLENVRIRGAQPGDEPQATNRGTAERPRYHVLGVLTSRDQLRLPGGTFARHDRARLKDYFDRLAADGAEALTAPRGMFGLTEAEIQAVFADLAQGIDFPTKGQSAPAVLERLQPSFKARFVFDPHATKALGRKAPLEEEFQGLTAGTSLAMILRREGLVLRPEKSRGQPVVFRIAASGPDAATPAGPPVARAARAGRVGDTAIEHWPVGWESDRRPGNLAPSLFEYLNAEIDGYTLQEALDAIAPRIKVPMYFDRATLAAHQIEPAKIQVRLARTRTMYKRVIDRVLAQARLGSELRVDEAGTPFLWITR